MSTIAQTSTNSIAHPEYASEAAHLERALIAVDRYLTELDSYNDVESGLGADAYSSAVLRSFNRQWMGDLQAVRETPYFARIDRPLETDQVEQLYIGNEYINKNGILIISWRAPAAALFYRAPSDGRGKAGLLLKRRFEIKLRTLQRIIDELDWRPSGNGLAAGTGIIVDANSFLKEVLEGQASIRLRQIVASIQTEQYSLIEADARQALVVQGVAGSGKTSVAVHRLSYLLYPGNAHEISPSRCIIFGPNRLFLNYTASVLPRLGVREIKQVTLVDWALDRMELSDKVVRDDTFEAVLTPELPRAQKVALYRGSRLKTSCRMGSLLERYVEQRRANISFPQDGWSFPALGDLRVDLLLSREQLQEVLKQFQQFSLSGQRRRFLRGVARILEQSYRAAIQQRVSEMTLQVTDLRADAAKHDEEAQRLEALADGMPKESHQIAEQIRQGSAGLRQLGKERRSEAQKITDAARSQEERALESEPFRKVMQGLQRDLERKLREIWPPLRLLEDYSALVADPNRLAALGDGIFDASELQLLCKEALSQASQTKQLDHSDIPALHYLHLLVNPPDDPVEPTQKELPYDHIVIDEAQDVSELEYATLLKFFSRNNSFTILGDLPQSIYSHRGISSWNQVREVFAKTPYTYSQLRRSYRTTFEIMSFANQVLSVIGKRRPEIPEAEPFERHGRAPQVQSCADEQALQACVLQAITDAQENGHKSIAILTKTVTRAEALGHALEQQGNVAIQTALTPEFDYQGGIVVLPVFLAKGIEFDAVIVVDADEKTYAETEFDGRMFYVAITRPLHWLAVFWVGVASPYIQQAQSGTSPAPVT